MDKFDPTLDNGYDYLSMLRLNLTHIINAPPPPPPLLGSSMRLEFYKILTRQGPVSYIYKHAIVYH